MSGSDNELVGADKVSSCAKDLCLGLVNIAERLRAKRITKSHSRLHTGLVRGQKK